MSFKDMVADDIHNVFLNLGEFAVKRTVEYDDVTYDGPDHDGIPIVLKGIKEKDRRQLMSDHLQGIFLATTVLHCTLDDLGGNQPEKGALIRINDEEGDGGFFRGFYVVSSICEMGMLRVELEATDE